MSNFKTAAHLLLRKICQVTAISSLAVALYLPGLLAASPALERMAPNAMGCTYLLQGKIDSGRAEQIERFIGKFRYVEPVLCMNSPGGSLLEGIKLAKFFRAQAVPTRVMAGHSCMSACAVAFMGGSFDRGVDHSTVKVDRAIHAQGRLGFHAPSLAVADGSYGKESVNKAYRIAVRGIAVLLNAADEIGIPLAAVETMLNTAPETFFDISTVGRSLQWDVAVFGLSLPEEITASMWLTACLNLSALNSDTGPYVPSLEQFVRVENSGMSAEVSLNSGTTFGQSCTFDLESFDATKGNLWRGELSFHGRKPSRQYQFRDALFALWHSNLDELAQAGFPSDQEHQIVRHVSGMPCSTVDGTQLSIGLCNLTEAVAFKLEAVRSGGKQELQAISRLKLSIPGRPHIEVEKDKWGQYGWEEYLPTRRGVIHCSNSFSNMASVCIAEDADVDFAKNILADCLNEAAAPFQSDGYDGVSIWSIDSAAATNICQAAARFDDPARNATTALARVHYGAGDPEGALQLYRTGAQAGNATAQNGMGIAYLYGKGTSRDVDEAQYWFARAMAQGHPFAFLHAGAIAERGLAGEPSIPQAIELYEQAASLGGTGGLVRIGNIHRRAKNLVEAARHYQRAADQGDTEAMVILASLNMEGSLGDEADLVAASTYYQRAADAGNKEAAYALALALEAGALLPDQTLASAESYLLQAADLGHAEAQFGYAKLAQARQDIPLAQEFLARAADLGHEQAAALLDQLH